MAGLRYLIILCVIFLGAAAPARVHAQSSSCKNTPNSCDQGIAYSQCVSETTALAKQNGGNYGRFKNCEVKQTYGVYKGYRGTYQLDTYRDGRWSDVLTNDLWWYPTGSECSTRVDGQAGMVNGTLYSGGVCDNGCKVQPNFDPGTDYSIRENGNPNAISIRSGTWKATGAVCTANDAPPRPEKKDEYCHQAAGYTVCKSKDKTCVSTASGFRTCATDASNTTGHTETNAPRTEAASIGAPNTPPNAPTNRPGENWQPSGNTTNITNNNTGSTTNTTTYNNQGTPNGNQPTPGDGSGAGQGGSNGNGNGSSGEGQGSGNTGSGGGDCSSPPVTGGDPVLGIIAKQTWATRCAAEKANAAKVTGDIGDCAAAFSVEGDSVQANQLRAQRAQLCAGKPGQGQGSSGDVHQGAEDAEGPGKWTWKFDDDLIDKTGFGGGSCPQLGTVDFGRFGAVSLDGQTWWCPLVAAMRAVMLLLGMFISFRIVFGD